MYLYITLFDDLDKAKAQVLEEYSRVCGKQATVDRLANGKPVLLLNKNREGDISFSHTENVLIAAISGSVVGVDIERKDRRISSNICKSIEEWTKKEAYGKYLGIGINRQILDKTIPEGLVDSFIWGDYVISLASYDKNVDIINLTR